jgi:hypothetical protein
MHSLRLGFTVDTSINDVPEVEIDLNGTVLLTKRLVGAGRIDDLNADQHFIKFKNLTKIEKGYNVLKVKECNITKDKQKTGPFAFQVRTIEVNGCDLNYFGVESTVYNPDLGLLTGPYKNYVNEPGGYYSIAWDSPLYKTLYNLQFGRATKDSVQY